MPEPEAAEPEVAIPQDPEPPRGECSFRDEQVQPPKVNPHKASLASRLQRAASHLAAVLCIKSDSGTRP